MEFEPETKAGGSFVPEGVLFFVVSDGIGFGAAG
jgi:hypothetical protein